MLTLIGDVHGKFDEYYAIASKREASVQLGDFGFSRSWNALNFSGLNPLNYQVIGGNHEDYDVCTRSPFYAGNYGVATINNVEFFFIRGGVSIDRWRRIALSKKGEAQSYWAEEELNFKQMLGVLSYVRERVSKGTMPSLFLSHVPPAQIIDKIHSDSIALTYHGLPSSFREATSLLWDEIFKIVKPTFFISGHHHKRYKIFDGITIFVGLEELGVCEVTDGGKALTF